MSYRPANYIWNLWEKNLDSTLKYKNIKYSEIKYIAYLIKEHRNDLDTIYNEIIDSLISINSISKKNLVIYNLLNTLNDIVEKINTYNKLEKLWETSDR